MPIVSGDALQPLAGQSKLLGVPAALLDNLSDSAVEGPGRFLGQRIATTQANRVRGVPHIADRFAEPIGLGEHRGAKPHTFSGLARNLAWRTTSGKDSDPSLAATPRTVVLSDDLDGRIGETRVRRQASGISGWFAGR